MPARARVGAEARQDRIRPVGLFHTEARQRLATTRQDDVDETSGGAYAELGLIPLSWLRAVAGVRYDAYRFHVRSSDPRNGGDADAGRVLPKGSGGSTSTPSSSSPATPAPPNPRAPRAARASSGARAGSRCMSTSTPRRSAA